MNTTHFPIKRALISVSDKSGLIEFATALAELRCVVAAERLREPRQSAHFAEALTGMLG